MSLPELIYIADPLCSWCYGFSDPMHKVLENLSGRFHFKLLMGGLRPFEHAETLTPELAEFLGHHWQQVEKLSGVPFDYRFLQRIGLRYDTGPASRAVVTVRRLRPDAVFRYLMALQRRLYTANIDPNDVMALAEVAENYGLSSQEFMREYENQETLKETLADFSHAAALKVRGFPSLIVRQPDGSYVVVTQGYVPAEHLLLKLEELQTMEGPACEYPKKS